MACYCQYIALKKIHMLWVSLWVCKAGCPFRSNRTKSDTTVAYIPRPGVSSTMSSIQSPMQLNLEPSLDVASLLARKRDMGGWYQHLEAWTGSNLQLKQFSHKCYDAMLDDLLRKPRVRTDGREPQFFVQTEGEPKLATPYSNKRMVHELLLKRVRVGSRDTQTVRMAY